MLHSFRLRKLNMAAVIGALLLVGSVAMLLGTLRSDADAATRNGGLNLTAAEKTGKKAKAYAPRFGNRTLREGMTGADVKVLKGIVRSKALLRGSALSESFDRPTTSAVKNFQRDAKMRRSGVVNKTTAKKLVGSLRTAGASWYGPGFWGNKTACGNTLRPTTMGVAHKKLPCGSKVLIGYKGRYVFAKVIDRGPFIKGRAWDLTLAVSDALKFTPVGVGKVRHAVISRKK